jgi:hypothetical protein
MKRCGSCLTSYLVSCALTIVAFSQLAPPGGTEDQNRLPRSVLDDERHELLVQLLAKRPVAPVVPINDLGERDRSVVLAELFVLATAPLRELTPKLTCHSFASGMVLS